MIAPDESAPSPTDSASPGTASAPNASQPRPSLWRNPNYVAWLFADTSWQFGTSVRGFAMTFVVMAVTGSTAQAGTVATVTTLVALICMIPGGNLVDRWDRRLSLELSGALRTVVYATAAITWSTGTMTLPVLYVIAITSGMISGLFGTASDAALRSVVSTRDLPVAVSTNQGRDAAVSLSASPIAGALIGISYALPFAVAAAGAAIQAIATHLIRVDLRPPRPPEAGRRMRGPAPETTRSQCGTTSATVDQDEAPTPSGSRHWLTQHLPGLAIFIDNPMLRRLLPATILVNTGFGGLYFALNLVLQRQGVAAFRIAFIDVDMAVGMLLGALIAPRLIPRIPTGRLTIVLFIGAIITMLPVAFVHNQVLVLACFMLTGLQLPALNGAMGGYIQALIPPALQGRALATVQFVGASLPALAPALAGFALEQVAPLVVMTACVAIFGSSVLFLLTNRTLRELPTPDQWEVAD